MASTAIFLPPTPPLLNVANVWFSPAKDLRGGLKNDEESPCAGAWWLSLSVYTSKEWDSWNCQAGTRFLSILEQSVWAEDPSLLPPLLFQPPEEQDIFSEHKKLLFVSPQDLLRSGGGQGDKICWDQKLREMEKQIMQRNLPQSLKDNYDYDGNNEGIYIWTVTTYFQKHVTFCCYLSKLW